MQTTKVVATTAVTDECEPLTLQKRRTVLCECGSTTFTVTIHFCEDAKETLEDKILRLIEQEAQRDERNA